MASCISQLAERLYLSRARISSRVKTANDSLSSKLDDILGYLPLATGLTELAKRDILLSEMVWGDWETNTKEEKRWT